MHESLDFQPVYTTHFVGASLSSTGFLSNKNKDKNVHALVLYVGKTG